jgi:hypothetical protein
MSPSSSKQFGIKKEDAFFCGEEIISIFVKERNQC